NAVGIVVRAVALAVLVDVRADQPELAVADVGVRLGQARPAVAERLDLRALEHDPGLDPVQELIVVPRTTVVDDGLLALLPGHGRPSVGSARWSWPPPSARAKASCRGFSASRSTSRRPVSSAPASPFVRSTSPRTATCTPRRWSRSPTRRAATA